MKADDTELAAQLVRALNVVPKVRRSLAKISNERVLEIQAAEIYEGETQGAHCYFHVPPSLAGPILDAAEKVIRDKLKELGVTMK